MTVETDGRYIFSHRWEGEGERLAGIADAFDPVTRRHLSTLGVTAGWRCLEVGAGAGTIADWLSETVGPKGSVLATDLSVDLMAHLEAENLEIRRHDILADPLPVGEFDLIHCRLVLEHLPRRQEALAKMAAALAPGGWLLVEDMAWGTSHRASRKGAPLLAGLLATLGFLLRRNGWDGGFARELPIHLGRLGLSELRAEGTQLVLVGGTPSVDWARPTLRRIGSLLFEEEDGLTPGAVRKAFALAPPLRHLAERRLEGLERLFADPEFAYLAPSLISAWGRRPLATG